jgi:hypothetical protein
MSTRSKLELQIQKAPVAVQSMRKSIIENANFLIEEMREHDFTEVSEIVRACTALGIRRAYLRGLQHPITAEGDINKYIYRFNMLGALPFQDQATNGQFTKNAFQYYEDDDQKKTKSIMVQAITLDGTPYVHVKGNTVTFENNDPNKPVLPCTAFIPKYRDGGNDPDLPWLPYMKCSLLNNIPDSENCVSSTDITTTSIDRPDLNILIPYGTNQYPYMAPNSGVPYLKAINPKPKEFRMVLDGSPIEGEDVSIKNKYLLSGATEVSPGDPGTGTITNPITGDGPSIFTPGPGDNPGPGDGVIINNNTRFTLVTNDEDDLLYTDHFVPDYSGPVLYVRDPIRGNNTKFKEELQENNVIELTFPARLIGGTFYVVGTNTIYYNGLDFINKFHEGIRVNILGDTYTLSNQVVGEASFNTNHFQFDYTASYTISQASFTNEATQLISFTQQPVTIFSKNSSTTQCDIQFIDNVQKVRELFEVGDTILINNIPFAFQSIEGRYLRGAFRADGGNVSSQLGSQTLIRNAKNSRSSMTNVSGSLPEFRIYYKVSSVTSDTEIEITPPHTYNGIFEGHIHRVGIAIESVAQTPQMKNAFNVEGAAQFRSYNSATSSYEEDSPTFYTPMAVNDRVILYDHVRNDFTKSPTNLSAKPVVKVQDGLKSFFSSQVHDYYDFEGILSGLGYSFGELVYSESFDQLDEILNEQHIGSITFTDGADDYITLETIENDAPISHGFIGGDLLTIRRKRRPAPLPNEDPFGDCVSHRDSNYLYEFDYDHCGLQVEVQDVVSAHRFTVLKKGVSGLSQMNEFVEEYDRKNNPTFYLTATNGNLIEYWAKYFKTVYMDGSVNANSQVYSTSTETTTINFSGKGDSSSNYEYNYTENATQLVHKLGSTPIKVSTTSNYLTDIVPDSTEDGTFILSLEKSLTCPPRLLDSYWLRNAEFDEIPLT